MRALVTGATGFIGGALASALLEAGWEVRLLARPASLARLHSPNSFRILEGDLSQANPGLPGFLEGCDVVFHAAAIRDRYGTTQADYHKVNVIGTSSLLEAAVGRVGRFVYISSVGVYGAPGRLGIDETFSIAPGSGKLGYHTTKAEAEQVVMERAAKIEAVIVRPTITFGPGDQDGMVTRLIAMVAAGKFIRVGRGNNSFHLTYISDLVSGILLAGTHSSAAGRDFILSGPAAVQSGGFIRKVEQALGKKPARFYIPEAVARPAARLLEAVYRAGSRSSLSVFQSPPIITRDKIDTLCLHRSFSSAKAQNHLGYQPQISWEEGLERTIHWMKAVGLLQQADSEAFTLARRSKTIF